MKRILCIGLLISVCFACKGQISAKKQAETLSKPATETLSNEISLLFIGDFMGHKDQIDAAYNPNTGRYVYDSCFMPVKKLLSDADVTIGNLEVILGIKPYSGYPEFSSPAAYASAIKNAGVDVLMTSNNHSCDKRKKGVEKTIAVLDSLGIGHTGTFYDAAQKDSLPAYFINKNGISLAIINYTYGTNEIPPTFPNIVNYLDEKVIKNDIKRVKSYNPDAIIAFVHWGEQYKDLPNSKQKKFLAFFKENGVNIVIGAHPHVLQPMHWKKADSTTGESLVVYSLGNFISHQRKLPRDGGAVFKLMLQKNKPGEVVIKEAQYELTWVYEPLVNNKKYYFVLPVKEFEKNPGFFPEKKEYDKMMRFASYARNLLAEHNININENK